MNSKHLKIINYLIANSNWSSAKVISSQCNVSIRTIRTYITEINQSYLDLIDSSNKGYKINEEFARTIINNFEKQKKIPQTQKERMHFIIKKLLSSSLSHKNIVISDFEDELFISESTLKNDIKKVKNELMKYHLSLVTNKDHVTIEGCEKQKRKVISMLVHEETEQNFISPDKIQDLLPDYDIEYILNTVKKTLDKNCYYFNDYALFSLILHITISVDRIKQNYIATEMKQNIQTSEYFIAEEISHILGEKYNIIFPKQEIYELSLLLRSRTSKINYKNIKKDKLIIEIGSENYSLTKKIINEINQTYSVNLEDENFIVKFALHLNNLFIRSQNNFLNKNPLSVNIQFQYPLIYEIALFVANRLKEIKHLDINSDEIAYIALHIGGTLELKKNSENKISCLIISPQYYDQNMTILKRINENIPNLNVKDIIANEFLIDHFSDIDLIISTIDINYPIKTPLLTVSPFINENDLEHLNRHINKIVFDKRKNNLKSYFEKFMNEKLFFINYSKKTTKNEVIKSITTQLHKLNYTDDTFYQDVIKREKLSSTAFGNIAIPHSLTMNAKKTGIYIYISQNPIEWQNNKVELVLLLAIKQENINDFKDIYENLTIFLSEAENVQKIVRCQNYQEFIDTLTTNNTKINK